MAIMAHMAHIYITRSQRSISKSTRLAPCRSDNTFLPIPSTETPNHQVQETTNQNKPNKSMYNCGYHKILSMSFKRLTTSVRRMKENPGLSKGNPGKSNRAWKNLCERAQKVRAWLCGEWRRVWNVKRRQILG